jgi:hypothetical protein
LGKFSIYGLLKFWARTHGGLFLPGFWSVEENPATSVFTIKFCRMLNKLHTFPERTNTMFCLYWLRSLHFPAENPSLALTSAVEHCLDPGGASMLCGTAGKAIGVNWRLFLREFLPGRRCD